MVEQEQEAQGSQQSLGEIYFALFRHKWMIITCSTLGLAAAVGVFFVTPTVYRSEAKVLVRYIMDATVLSPVSSEGRVITPDRYGQNVINSEVEILHSRDLIDRVIDRIGMEGFQEHDKLDRLAIIMNLTRNIRVDVPMHSSIIRVTFDGPEPQLAQQVLKNLIEAYLEKHIETHRAVGAYEFLSQQTDQLRARLADTEEELRKIKTDSGVVSVEEARTLLATRLEDLHKELRMAESTLAASEAKVKALRAVMPEEQTAQENAEQPDMSESSALTKLYEKLDTLRDREIELLDSYGDDSIPVKNARSQIASTLERIKEMNPLFIEMGETGGGESIQMQLMKEETTVASMKATLEVLRTHLDEARAEAGRTELLGSRITQLERTKEIQESNFRHFSQSLEQARVDDALDARKMSSINVVQPATYPAIAYRPKLRRNMGIALALGVLGGIGLALCIELVLKHSLKTPGEIEHHLKLPLMVTIPYSAVKGRVLRTKDPKDPQSLLPAHRGAVDAESWELHGELRPYYEVLRDRVLLAVDPAGAHPHLVGVTSCAAGAGVSTIASGLAVTLARNGDGRVLLVNADVDHSTSDGLLQTNPASGMSGIIDLLSDGQGNTAVIQPNLYLLSADEVGADGTQVKSTQGFGGLIDHFRASEYDFIIFDMPPVYETSLAPRIAHLIDGVLLVAAAEETGKQAALRAKNGLERAEARILGTVLNKKREYVPRWLRDVT